MNKKYIYISLSIFLISIIICMIFKIYNLGYSAGLYDGIEYMIVNDIVNEVLTK